VEANANKDLATMKEYMSDGEDINGYTIGGRKYTKWEDFSRTMQEEFNSVRRLLIPITDLRVWQQGSIAWFSMELDYTREVETAEGITSTIIPLRETGVLERKNGKWLLLHWHESLRQNIPIMSQAGTESRLAQPTREAKPDLGGFWEIQEEDKSYIATLDSKGSGPYTWKNGHLETTEVSGRLWGGHWSQTGNDREGNFEVLLSEDFSTAEGVWWYTRVGDRGNIPARMHGGTYLFKRLTPEEAKRAIELAKEKEVAP